MKIHIWIKKEDALSGNITEWSLLPLKENYVQVSISIDEFAGTLTPLIKYLVVDPPSDTNTSNVAVVVRMLAKRKPTTASSLLAVSIVVAELVILAPFDSKSCAIIFSFL